MHRFGLLCSLLAGLVLSSCGTSADPQSVGDALEVHQPDTTLLHAGYSGFTAAERLVVRDSATWGRVWSQAFALQTSVPALPSVDFSHAMVIVAALGARPTGGYDITVERIVVEPGRARVLVRATAPSEECITTQAVTQPVVMVRARAVPGPIEFQERAQTLRCD